jgi:hypothetical protein
MQARSFAAMQARSFAAMQARSFAAMQARSFAGLQLFCNLFVCVCCRRVKKRIPGIRKRGDGGGLGFRGKNASPQSFGGCRFWGLGFGVRV